MNTQSPSLRSTSARRWKDSALTPVSNSTRHIDGTATPLSLHTQETNPATPLCFLGKAKGCDQQVIVPTPSHSPRTVRNSRSKSICFFSHHQGKKVERNEVSLAGKVPSASSISQARLPPSFSLTEDSSAGIPSSTPTLVPFASTSGKKGLPVCFL